MDYCKMISRGMSEAGVRSAKALSKATGVSASNLSKILNGQQEPSTATLKALSKVFGVKMSTMISWGE